jgi:hypothetical protein
MGKFESTVLKFGYETQPSSLTNSNPSCWILLVVDMEKIQLLGQEEMLSSNMAKLAWNCSNFSENVAQLSFGKLPIDGRGRWGGGGRVCALEMCQLDNRPNLLLGKYFSGATCCPLE